MPIRTRCSPTSTSRGGSERCGESVGHVDHDRVGGLTVIGVRGGLTVSEPRVAILRGWLWCFGVLAGGVLGNGVHAADGMTAVAIEHAASSRMLAGIARSLAIAGASVLYRMSLPPPPGHCGLRGR